MSPLISGGILPINCKLKTSLVQLILLISLSTIRSQIISHELRRLAVATNQFGIDSLRALDRIEPPEKVLVFCPVCLSSTLTMIMMGSSKFQVVSSLRHALYVWSMKPHEINRAFKDIFQHIGLNQNLKIPRAQAPLEQLESEQSHFYSPSLNFSNLYRKIGQQYPTRRSLVTHFYGHTSRYETLSLPSLIKFKDSMGNSAGQGRSWWHSIGKPRNTSSLVDPIGVDHSYRIDDIDRDSKLIDPRESIELSQMSAMCNIYLQRGLTMNFNYNLLLRQYYDTVIHPVDFLKNREETRNHINSLVAANTENKIKDLVKKSQLESVEPPKIMLISTFHFRGTLDIEMRASKKSTTSDADSNPKKLKHRDARSHKRRAKRDASQVKSKVKQYIETETSLLKYGHFTSLGCSVIEIPFSNRLVTLVVVMPDHLNTTDLLLTRLSAQVLNDMINSLVVKKLSLEIPVIKFDRGPINSDGLLKELGLDNLFFGNQTFSTETGLNRWMRGSDILHETSIDIGTLNPNWGLPEDRLKVGAHESRSLEANHIRLDKPFFYFVMDSINSLILTMGRIRQ